MITSAELAARLRQMADSLDAGDAEIGAWKRDVSAGVVMMTVGIQGIREMSGATLSWHEWFRPRRQNKSPSTCALPPIML